MARKAVPLDNGHRSMMRRAELVLGTLAPKHLPVLLDALTAHAAQSIKIIEPRFLLNEDWRDYARGEVAEPSDRLRDVAAVLHTTTEEMGERFRAQNIDDTNDFHSTRAIYFGQVLAHSSVLSRHAIYCTEEMAALVRSAANKEVSESALTEADLPSPSGIAVLYDRTDTLILRWATTSSGLVSANLAETKGILRLLQDEFADPDFHIPQPFEQAQLSEPLSDDPPGEAAVIKPFGADGQYGAIRPDNAIATLFALSHLSRQPALTSAEIESVKSPMVDRRGRRRTRTDQITYLGYNTNEQRHRREEADDRPGRNYSHRWVVRGHWRRQWYPSQNRHIPIWITDYVAGPTDLPIEHRDKVRIVKPPAN